MVSLNLQLEFYRRKSNEIMDFEPTAVGEITCIRMMSILKCRNKINGAQ